LTEFSAGALYLKKCVKEEENAITEELLGPH
jgi:hypothetical protein